MKAMCPPSCHQNGVVATYSLGHMMHIKQYILCQVYEFLQNHYGDMSFHKTIVVMTGNANCYHVIKLFHFMYSIHFQVGDLDFPDLSTYLFFKQKLNQIYKKRQIISKCKRYTFFKKNVMEELKVLV